MSSFFSLSLLAVIVAALLDIVANLLLAKSQGFRRKFIGFASLGMVGLAFYALSLAVRDMDLAVAYASADMFVFPSTTDTFGNVILEAQASGIPAIVSDVGGPRDLVLHGKDGFVTKSLDSTELAGAIRTLVEHPSLRHHMGLAGRGKVESRDWTEAFEKFWRESPE